MTTKPTPKDAAKPAPTYQRETAWRIPAAEGRTRGVTFRLEADRVYVSMGGHTVPVSLALFAGATAELVDEAGVQSEAIAAVRAREAAEATARPVNP